MVSSGVLGPQSRDNVLFIKDGICIQCTLRLVTQTALDNLHNVVGSDVQKEF